MKKSRSSSNGSAGLAVSTASPQAVMEGEGPPGSRALSPRRSRRLATLSKREELSVGSDSDTSASGAAAETQSVPSDSEHEPVARHHLPFASSARECSCSDNAQQQPSANASAAATTTAGAGGAPPLSCSSSLAGNSPQPSPPAAAPPLTIPWSVQQPEVASPTAAADAQHQQQHQQHQQQDGCSVGIRSGLAQTQSADCLKSSPPQDGDSCGLWGLLPEEVSSPATVAAQAPHTRRASEAHPARTHSGPHLFRPPPAVPLRACRP